MPGVLDFGRDVNAKEFGLRLRELRLSKSLSQAELAEKVGVTTAAVGNWEQGTRRPTFPEDLFKIAEALKIDVAELLVKSKTQKEALSRGRPKKSADDEAE